MNSKTSVVLVLAAAPLLNLGFSSPCAAVGCPPGYHPQGILCVGNDPNTKPMMPRPHSGCPAGWYPQGAWCVKG